MMETIFQKKAHSSCDLISFLEQDGELCAWQGELQGGDGGPCECVHHLQHHLVHQREEDGQVHHGGRFEVKAGVDLWRKCRGDDDRSL